MFLTVIGADRMGRKHLIALREAMSESEVAWEELFADLASRGLAAPALLIADGANGAMGSRKQSLAARRAATVLASQDEKHRG